MTKLIFIRHAPTKIDKHTSAKNWLLSEDSTRLCQLLAKKIKHYTISKIYTSTELKTQLTGQYIADALKLDMPVISDNLQETAYNIFYESHEEFLATVKLAMQNPHKLIFGYEKFSDAKKRFSVQVDSLAKHHPQETIAIVTHGRVLSMFLGDFMPENPEIIWERLQMPAYAVVSWETKEILEIMYSVDNL